MVMGGDSRSKGPVFSPGLVVMGGDSRSKGPVFEPWSSGYGRRLTI